MGQVTRSLGGMTGQSGQKSPPDYRNHQDYSMDQWHQLLLPYGAAVPIANIKNEKLQPNQFVSAIATMLEDPLYQLK